MNPTVMKKYFISLSCTMAALVALTAVSAGFSPQTKLNYAEKIIEHYYVGDIDTTEMVDEALRAMLATLDPHSSYSTPEETRDLNEPLQGNFSGIGISFNLLNDTLHVIQTVAGGPSEKVGILAGDRILMAGDSVMSGAKRKNTDIRNILRGPKGSEVNLKVYRPGTPGIINFHVTRDDIPVYSVDASYMVDPTTGYIRITRFADDTPNEVEKALKKLLSQGMKDIIIDLQDNGGGYLGAVSSMAEYFLPHGSMIVYTEGERVPPSAFLAEGNEIFPADGKIVVLVNQYSASAAEIFAGAIQDNDRGIIVGRRTFGKGLVQRPFPFPDGSMIRLTVSRYHTPSGRCIQKPYTPGDEDEYSSDMTHRYESGEFFSADSIKLPDGEIYYTKHLNRPVKGGGGIMPDIFVPLDTTAMTKYFRDLRAKGLITIYEVQYLDKNRKDLKKRFPDAQSFLTNFNVDSTMIAELEKLAAEKEVEPNPEQLNQALPLINTQIKGLIARDLFGMDTAFQVYNPMDPVYVEGLKAISDPETYQKILSEQK